MTVAQLREALARLPEDAVVLMDNGGGLSRVAGFDLVEEQGAGAPAEVILLPSMEEWSIVAASRGDLRSE